MLDYNDGIIKHSYRMNEVDALPASDRMEFMSVHPGSRKDSQALETWMNHFRLVQAPFVTKIHRHRNRQHLVLWKRRLISPLYPGKDSNEKGM